MGRLELGGEFREKLLQSRFVLRGLHFGVPNGLENLRTAGVQLPVQLLLVGGDLLHLHLLQIALGHSVKNCHLVGGSAQIKAMKQVAGSLRLDLASYRELQAFTQFGSDLDKATQDQLTRGSHMTELLKQGRYMPMPVAEQVVAIFAGNEGFLDDLPLTSVVRFRTELLASLRASKPEILQTINTEKKLSDETKVALKEAIAAFKQSFDAAA